jgi:hypothetical protein
MFMEKNKNIISPTVFVMSGYWFVASVREALEIN